MDARSRIAYRDYQILETVSQDNPSLDNPVCVAPQRKWEMLAGVLGCRTSLPPCRAGATSSP